MQLFQLVQKRFASLGITSHQSTQKNPFNLKLLATFTSYTLAIISYNVYLFCVANTFWEYINNVYLNSAALAIFACFVITVFSMRRIFEFIGGCVTIANYSLDYPESKAIYEKSSQRIETYSRIIYLVLFKITPICFVAPVSIGSLFIYFANDFDNEALKLPIPMWFPFDTNNLIGYLIAIALEYVSNALLYFFNTGLVPLAIGIFLFTLSMTEDIKANLNSVNEMIKTKAARSKIYAKISHSIRLHSRAKQLIHTFSKVFRHLFMALFTWSFCSITGSMLMFQMELSRSNTDVVILLTALFYAWYSFGLSYIACELGQQINNAFEEIEDFTGQYQWYLFPNDVKRILPMILINFQESVELQCFGSFSCCREAFKKVVGTAYSYFTVLRTFV